jgi:abhydrolase domain-containing protein 17
VLSHALLQAHVALVEYPGYGVCKGSPSESSVKRAALEATRFLEGLGFPAANIILYGRSIGSGAATHVAAEYARQQKPVGGLILQRYRSYMQDDGIRSGLV